MRRLVEAYREGTRDMHRHLKFGGLYEDRVTDEMSPRQVERQLTKDYHRVEKGLALPEPKRPFGSRPSERMRQLLSGRVQPELASVSGNVESALRALTSWNDDGVIESDLAPHLVDVFDSDGGSQPVSSLDALLRSRRSVRNFDGVLPQIEQIRQAVETAATAPSVCNRQPWFAHYFTAEAAERVLKLQNGNAGFRSTIPAVFVITTDVQLFSGSSERNQRWIDGGLFAMNLSVALHAQGLSTCFLNWSASSGVSERMRDVAGIPESQDIITLLAVGYSADGARVARSPRRPLAEVLKIHGETN